MTIKIDQAYGHLQSLECCIQNIVEALPSDLDKDSMVWDYIDVALKELGMAQFILNKEEIA